MDFLGNVFNRMVLYLMIWVIQNNLWEEAGYVRFVKELDRLGIEYVTVKPVPFTNIILPADFDCTKQDISEVDEPYIDSSKAVIACGATSLCRIAKAKGWTPGSFLNENYTYEKWANGFGKENCLNGDAVVSQVQHAVCDLDKVFVRPVEDSKAFNGQLMTKDQFNKWKDQISKIDPQPFQPLSKETEIMVCAPKPIYAEYRFFIVDGIVISGSMYKRGTQVFHDSEVDQYITDFAQEMVDKWQPNIAFVIDVAQTDNGLKIIEMGNINSAGFYKIDVNKYIIAMEELHKKYYKDRK